MLAGCRERAAPPLTPRVTELPTEDPARRVLVFTVAATGVAHVWRGANDGSRYYVRVGRETREARNGLVLELLSRRGQLPPWDRRHPADATVADIDLLALRDLLIRIGREASVAVEPLVSDAQTISAFVPPLCAREPLGGVLRPRNFALLLFGRVPQQACTEAFCLFSKYPGTDRAAPVSVRHEIGGTIVQQAQRLVELLDAEAYVVMDKRGAGENLRRYPLRALQEAVVNAWLGAPPFGKSVLWRRGRRCFGQDATSRLSGSPVKSMASRTASSLVAERDAKRNRAWES